MPVLEYRFATFVILEKVCDIRTTRAMVPIKTLMEQARPSGARVENW
jgi:hypothetical protein